MVIVTAADRRYFRGLLNLVGSIHYWSPEIEIIIYDLGMEMRMLEEIDKWNKVTLVSNFIDSNIPPHCKNLKQYAWKPVIMHAAIQSHASILWIDAGSDLRAPVDSISSFLNSDGHFFVQGQDMDMTLISHEDTYLSMHTTKQSFSGKPHYAGSLQGYVKDSRAHKEILDPMCEYALDEDCIAPPGSYLGNHRYDQTLLSILLHQSDLPVNTITHLLAARREQLPENPLQASTFTVYSARCSSVEYIAWIRNSYNELCYVSKHNPLAQ